MLVKEVLCILITGSVCQVLVDKGLSGLKAKAAFFLCWWATCPFHVETLNEATMWLAIGFETVAHQTFSTSLSWMRLW